MVGFSSFVRLNPVQIQELFLGVPSGNARTNLRDRVHESTGRQCGKRQCRRRTVVLTDSNHCVQGCVCKSLVPRCTIQTIKPFLRIRNSSKPWSSNAKPNVDCDSSDRPHGMMHFTFCFLKRVEQIEDPRPGSTTRATKPVCPIDWMTRFHDRPSTESFRWMR